MGGIPKVVEEIRELGERIAYSPRVTDRLLLEIDESSGSRAFFVRWLVWVRPADGGAIITIERGEIPRAPYIANAEWQGESYLLSFSAINILYERGILYIPLSFLIHK